MDKGLKELIEISQFYGKNKDYVIAGGGNTSYKNHELLWVKGSGTSLATIKEDGFAVLYRNRLKNITTNTYSTDVNQRESEVKKDLYLSMVDPFSGIRPSVETSLHEIIEYSFVVHTHPTQVNGVLCSKNSKETIARLFGDKALFVEYTDPGYILFKQVERAILDFRKKQNAEPKLIFLQNHGIFVAANTIVEIKELYQNVEEVLNTQIKQTIQIETIPLDDKLVDILPVVRMKLSDDKPKVVRSQNSSLLEIILSGDEGFSKITKPFTPDMIVYCKANYLFVESEGTAEEIIAEFNQKLETFKSQFPYLPKVVVLKGLGVIAAEDNARSADVVLKVFEDLMKVSLLSENFGGQRFMTDEEIAFIDNWEVENYRRKIAKGSGSSNAVDQKIAIVTGGAQGFGGGIVEHLIKDGANVVIADINEEKGQEFAAQLNEGASKNLAAFVKADVSNPQSVENLVNQTVKAFGGLDLMISNAGVLRAGGLDEMQADTFDFMTKVNYNGYFLCAKFASKIMKLQAAYKPDHFTDIVQVNSKSGLKGSNKNFAYAGGKFGGIGLTQSFAMELMPHRIKVNSVCPGNFFDGPLWSDPENGLFVQYLKAGKVPGAKTLADVKKFYEDQVPAKRGCFVEDVIRAIYYAIEQKYETGQAIPVTGGQIMLS